MGSPIAPLLADVVMNHVIDEAFRITPSMHHPCMFCRYVDDCFVVSNDEESLNKFFNNLNEIHTKIKFTKELEVSGVLPFLDVLIENSAEGLKTSTYRKPTHTGLYTRWLSFIPKYMKSNIVNKLLQRSYTICSTYKLIVADFERIASMLQKHGYPRQFITGVFAASWTENTGPA